MRSAVYLNGSKLMTNSRTIAQISMELKKQIQDDFLIFFDDKNLFSGNEELQQVQGRLNIFQSKYILKVSEDFERLKREGEIKLNELKALQFRLEKQKESFENEQKSLSEIFQFEINILKQQISKFDEKENHNIQKIENLKKKQVELELLLGQKTQNVQNIQQIQISSSEHKEKAQQNILSQLSQQITELRIKNKQLQIQIENKNQESVIIKNSKQVVDFNHNQLKQEIQQMEQLRNSKDQEIQRKNQEINELRETCDKLQEQIDNPKGPTESQIFRNNNETNQLKVKLENLKEDLQKRSKELAEEKQLYENQRDFGFNLQRNIKEEQQKSINLQKLLEQKKEELEKIQVIQKQNEIELEANKQQLEEYVHIKQELEKKIVQVKQKSIKIQDNLNQQVKDCQTLIDNLGVQINQKDETIKQLEEKIKLMKTQENKQEEINVLELQKTQLVSDKQGLVKSKDDYQKNLAQNKRFLLDIEEVVEVANQINNQNNEVLRFIQDRKKKADQDIEEMKFQAKERQRIKKEQEDEKIRLQNQLYKIKRSKLEEDLRKKCKEISDMQICFLIDTTNSMETYLEQTLNCVSTCINTINQKLNRQIRWAIATYKDFDWRDPYDYLGFTKDQIELINFSKRIKCTGGGDEAEDIEGGFNIVLDQNKIQWTQPLKVCILIADSPCHGRRFTNGSDDYPNYDLEPLLIKMMQAGISLIGIKLNKSTDQMYSKFQKIYQDQNREELLDIFDLQNKEVSTLWQDFSVAIAQISVKQATQNKNTMSKDQNLGANKVGSMQALIEKLKDPTKFEEVGKPRDVNLEVIRVELKQDDLSSQIRELVNLSKKIELIQSSSQGTWQCKMSKQPFAKGQNKSVYVMRKQNNYDEVYVLKGLLDGQAYPSLETANRECFTHLVAKFLMEEYKKCLVQQNINHPQVIYSDILILKESKDQFWIAERFFKGEFEKYNSNFGYINEKITDLNHFAQGFTLFTLSYCESYQMIVDIQGVGNYWTDPAINTKLGGFDVTDMGEDGLSMYLINKDIDAFKGLGLKYKIN